MKDKISQDFKNSEFYSSVEIKDFYKLSFAKNDTVIGKILSEGRPWEPEITKLIEGLVRENSTFIDVGANIGVHTVGVANRVNCTVEAFEPIQFQLNILQNNIKINNLEDRVNVNPVGLTNQNTMDNKKFQVPEEIFDLSKPANYGGHGLIIAESEDNIIPMKTMDSFNFTNVSVIKIDVEGHEQEVLEGSFETIRNNKPHLVVEIWDDLLTKFQASPINQLFFDLDYGVTKMTEMDYLFSPKS